MSKRKNIMDNILSGSEDKTSERTEELNCLIYKDMAGLELEMPKEIEDHAWKVSKENVSVQIGKDKARIKVKVSVGKKKRISIQKIADIAVNAILEEINKGE